MKDMKEGKPVTYFTTRRSILGSDGMTKSDCSLALSVPSECCLSAL